MSPSSDEKALPEDDTMPDGELLWPVDDEDGAKAVAAGVPLLDDPKSAARLLLVLVSADRDDICCLREKLPLQS